MDAADSSPYPGTKVIGAYTTVAPAARAASSQLARVLQHSGLFHHARHRRVQSSALGGEVVLILDQHHCGSLWIYSHVQLPRSRPPVDRTVARADGHRAESERRSGYHRAAGRLAQLVERLPYKQEVGGSSPSPPTRKSPCKTAGPAVIEKYPGQPGNKQGKSKWPGRDCGRAFDPVVLDVHWAVSPGRAGWSVDPEQPGAMRPARFCESAAERTPVTPEVAGSSPVAPVSQSEPERAISRHFLARSRTGRSPPRAARSQIETEKR